MIETTIRPDGVAILAINTPGTQNTLNDAFNVAFCEAVDQLLADASVSGIILTSAKDAFAAGGDLQQLLLASSPAAIRKIVQPMLTAVRKLERGGKPVVAALNGTTLGGGYELALGTHRRIAADRPDTLFGLPETSLGLMPGGGGTQRLARLIGIEKAADLILSGKTMPPREALAAGLVDEIVPKEKLIDAAAHWIASRPTATQPWDEKGFALPGSDPNSVSGRRFFAASWAKMRARTGTYDQAATSVLYALHHGLERSIDAGIAIETRQFSKLAASPYAKNKIRTLFYGPRATRPRPSANAGHGVTKLGIVGGGTMGNGIAFAASRAGLDVVLVDISDDKAVESAARLRKIGERLVSRRRMAQTDLDSLLARIRTTADYAALTDAGFVIEAVFERLDVKRDVLRKLQDVLQPHVSIASNTSSIRITSLAEALADPSRMIGMHFFAPVETMKLLEVIRTPQTSERTFDQAQYIAAAMKKTQIVVRDATGFYTSRLVSSLSSEAMTLLAEGVPPQLIDNVMVKEGFAIGPATLAELTKLPLLRDIMLSMSGADAPVCMMQSRAVEALEKLVAAGRAGREAGKGIYDYDADGPRQWPGLSELFTPAVETPDPVVVQRRLLNAHSLEAARAIETGIIADPLAADLAAVLGWSYPAHLGGPLAYIDTIGVSAFVSECDELAEQFGPRFEPPPLLRRMAAENSRFHKV